MKYKLYEITLDLGFGAATLRTGFISGKNKQEAMRRALRNYPYAKVKKLKVHRAEYTGTKPDLVTFDEVSGKEELKLKMEGE